jgi:uncharacterized protein
MKAVKFIAIGFYFGLILLKAEAVSWYRIVEMFHFQSFHMFGVIGTAIVTGIISVQSIKYFKLKSFAGEEILLPKKPETPKANLLGGILFGIGWSLVGACTAPLFIQVGLGNWIALIPLVGAFSGALVYGIIKNKLPH